MIGSLSSRHKAFIAITACVLFWGFSFISIKIALPVFPPMTLGAVRFALAVALLFLIKLKTGRKDERLCLRDLPWLAGSGLAGITFYFFCENNGVARVSASEASIITAAIPVLSMITGWAAGKFRPAEQPGLRRWLGAFISMIGVSITALFSPVQKNSLSSEYTGSASGYLFMGGAALCWVAYSFLTEPLFRRTPGNSAGHSQIFIVFWQSCIGFLAFIPFAALEIPLWGRPSILVISHVVFLGVFCSALGHWFYVYSLEKLGVPVSSVFINLIPVVTVIAGFIVLGERLAGLQWIGAVMVLGGVYLTTRKDDFRKAIDKKR